MKKILALIALFFVTPALADNFIGVRMCIGCGSTSQVVNAAKDHATEEVCNGNPQNCNNAPGFEVTVHVITGITGNGTDITLVLSDYDQSGNQFWTFAGATSWYTCDDIQEHYPRSPPYPPY